MSFASQAREEIARRSLQKDCCVRAAAYGIACFAKYFDASGLVLQTEQELTTQVASQLFARCGVQGDIIEKQRPSGWSMSSASAHRSRWRGCTSFRHHRHRDEPADRPPTDSLPDVRQRVHRGSFCAAARSLTRKRSITSSFSPAARTLRATSRPCWRSTSLRPPHPPQRREPCLRQELRQRGAHHFLYGSGGGIGPAQRPEGCQADAQPNQPPHKLRYRKPGQDGPCQRQTLKAIRFLEEQGR